MSAFRSVMRLYFRQIERVGDPPTASTRGRVIVSNHHNALIDPILVLTDTPCEISPVAKSTLWRVPGLRWILDNGGAVPIVRRTDAPDKQADANGAAFERIAGHLAAGGNILIFPEGTSHSEPQLAPLRTGAARMLEAAAERGDAAQPLTFQAAALEFDARDDFRSRCLVLWGPVRPLADISGAGEDRVRAVTVQMDADLRELLVEGATHAERLLIARVAELLANDTGDDSLAAWNTIGRQVELASTTLRQLAAPVVADVEQRVTAYFSELARFGLRDTHLVHGDAAPPTARDGWVRDALLAPLALAGFVLYAPPYFIPRWAARKTDADAVSTIKLGAALVVYPLWAAGLLSLCALLPPPLSLAGAAIVLTSPFAALRWLDVWYQRVPHPPTPTQEAALGRLRTRALESIADARGLL